MNIFIIPVGCSVRSLDTNVLNVQFVLQEEWACGETSGANGSLLGSFHPARYYCYLALLISSFIFHFFST